MSAQQIVPQQFQPFGCWAVGELLQRDHCFVFTAKRWYKSAGQLCLPFVIFGERARKAGFRLAQG